MKFRLRFRLPVGAFFPYIIAAAIALGLLTTRLVSLAPRLSPSEQATLGASHSLHSIANNPLLAPMKALIWLAHFAPVNFQVLAVRLVSVIFALIALAAFTFILHRWYGRRSMIFGFALFVTSAAYLHIARFAGFDVLYPTAMLVLLAVHIAINDNEESARTWFLWLVANILLLFVPGMIWFVLLSTLWQWRAIVRAIRSLAVWQRIVSAIMAVFGLGALVQAIVRDHALLFSWLGLPVQLHTLQNIHHGLLATLLSIAYRSAAQPEQWLGHLPLLDIFTLFMVLVGLAFYAQHWRASRTHMLVGYLVLGIVLVSAGVVSISALIPLLYIISTGGIAYTLHFWLRKFPRNPIARYAGIVIIAAVSGLACYYNLVQYFVAWPHNPETFAIYQAKK